MTRKPTVFDKQFFIRHAVINIYMFSIVSVIGVLLKSNVGYMGIVFLVVSIIFGFIASETENSVPKDLECPLH